MAPEGSSLLKVLLNGKKYIKVLSSRLKPQIHESFRGNPCILQQDSAPCHIANEVYD